MLGPTLEDLRPGARALGPSLRETRPFLTQDDADHPRRDPPVRARGAARPSSELRPALRDLAAATPNLTRSFKVVNALLNTLAYNPPGEHEEGYLFWLSWANHLGATVFATQDAHGPIRHGLVVLVLQTRRSCSTASRGSNPQLGTLVALLNAPDASQQICPHVQGQGARMNKSAPSFGRIAAMVVFALSCFGLLLFLWLAFGGAVPLKPKGYRVQRLVRRGDAARHRGRRADLRRPGRQGQDDRARQADAAARSS